MPSTTFYALTMLLAGIGVPMLAALNAALGVRLGSPVAAAVVLFCIATLAALAVLVVSKPAAILGVMAAPRHLLLGGVLIAFYVLTITFVAPRFGVGNAVFFVLLGQLMSAALIDQFGLFGNPVSPLTPTRLAGIAMMAAGVFVTQRA
ncbi:MAG: DMT family transporter [Pseudomonadota bacterium]